MREVPHLGLLEIFREGGRMVLRHRLSGEDVELPGGHEWGLQFSPDGFGYIVAHGVDSRWAHTLFQESVQQDTDFHLWLVRHNDGGSKRAYDPNNLKAVAKYLQMVCDGGAKRLRLKSSYLPWRAVGRQVFFEARLLLVLLDPGSTSKSTHKYMNNQWKTWDRLLDKVFPREVLLLKSRDRSGRDRAWERMLPEASWSTCATLLLLCYAAVSAKPASSRPIAMDCLQSLCDYFLQGQQVVFEVGTEEADGGFELGDLPDPSMELAVDDGEMWVRPLFELVGSSLFNVLHEHIARLLDARPVPHKVPVWSVLVAAYAMDELWLIRQLFSATTVALEHFYLQDERLRANPLDFACDFEHLLSGRRHDDELMDKLTMCKGASHGKDDEQVLTAASHMLSYKLLHPKGKYLKKVSIPAKQNWIMLRYLYVGLTNFSQVRHVSISSDGTRLGCKDILKAVLQAFDKRGNLRCMWCPPQVARRLLHRSRPSEI